MRYVSLAAAAATAWVLVAVTAACLTDPHLTQYAAAAPLVVFQPAGVLALPIISLAYCAQVRAVLRARLHALLPRSLPHHASRLDDCASTPLQFQVIPQYWSLPHESRKHMPAVIHVSTLAIALPICTPTVPWPYLALPSLLSDRLQC
jgi:hypothetical protein